ncbi:MAG: helix-turn-helix domain-containing protein [Bacteroidota bacterium]
MIQAMSNRERLQQHALRVVHRPVSKQRILMAVSSEFRIAEQTLLSGSSADAVVVPRSVAHIFMMMLEGYTLERVGRELGGKNYSTVIHGLKAVVREYDVNVVFRKRLERIREQMAISTESFQSHINRWRRA